MDWFKKTLLRENTFLGMLGIFLVLRLIYVTSRDIFSSGPDAPYYAIAPVEFAKYGFWSDQIQGAPYYPIGYPVILSPFVELGGTNWILFAQIFQVLVSIATIWIVYKISNIFFKKEISLAIGFIFLLKPAFIPMSGQAMYEPLVMFTFYAYLLLILKEISSTPKLLRIISAGVLAGITATIHPRTIPWILIIQFIAYRKLGFKPSLIFSGTFITPVLLIIVRNGLAFQAWSLATAGSIFLPALESGNFGKILKSGFINAVYFWSPSSGDAKRATWFHNWTFYHEIKSVTDSTALVLVLAIIVATFSLITWLYGARVLIQSDPIIGKIVLCVPLIAWATDFFTSGDSRHRLVVIPLLLIGQVWAVIHIYRKFRPSRIE
jgi:hypothetical protein